MTRPEMALLLVAFVAFMGGRWFRSLKDHQACLNKILEIGCYLICLTAILEVLGLLP